MGCLQGAPDVFGFETSGKKKINFLDWGRGILRKKKIGLKEFNPRHSIIYKIEIKHNKF